MKNKHLLLLLLMALVAPWAANAQTQTLTVCDGDDGFNNNFIPIAGTYVDTQGTISEFIIPSTTEGMAGMVGASISKLTFYLPSVPPDTWGNPTFQWYMGEVEGTTLNSAYGPSSFTTVATGVWGNQSSTLEVEFDTPYVYGGGNLLIGSYLQIAAGWAVVNYLGIYTDDNTAVYHSYNSSTQVEFDKPQKFLPKTTFTYETCQKPTGLTVNDVTNSSVALSWTENGSATHWQIDCCTNPNFTCTPYYDEVSNTPSYSITQWLESGTTYYARVRAVCSNDWYSEWSDAVSFTTKHDPVAVGDSWTDNFEGYTCGWDFVNGTQTNQWVWGTATNNTEGGSKALYISNDGGTSNDYTNNSASVVYATKPFTFAQSGYYGFLYDWKNHGEGLFGDTGAPTPFDYLRVVLAPGTVALTPGELLTDLGHNWLPNGWIALDGGHCLSGQDEWLRNYEETYLQAGTYTMVFVWRNDDSGGYYPAAIDNVSITSVSCPRPTGLTIDNVTNNYVYYHFDSEPGAAYQYTIAPSNTTYTEEQLFQYVTPRVAQSTTFSGAYSMYGEDLDTDYYFYLRRKCGEDDYSATVTVLFHSSDLCADLLSNDLPYTEDFEEYIVGENVFWGVPLSECWDAYNSSIDAFYSLFPLVNQDNGAKRLIFASDIADGTVDPHDQYAILPPMENVRRLKMTLYAKSGTNLWTPFQVGVMQGKDASTFTAIGEPFATTDDYQEYNVSFENYIGNGNRIAIKMDAANAENTICMLYVDNITVEELPCLAPTNLQITNVTSTDATVSWEGSVMNFNFEFKPASSNDWFRIGIAGNSISFSSLANTPGIPALVSNTTYDVRVQTVCDGDDVHSAWTTGSFTTLDCPTPTNLAVNNVTANSADLSWTGSPAAENYTVGYRTVAVAGDTPILAQGFEDVNDMGGWYIGNGNATCAEICTEAAYNGDNGFKLTACPEGNPYEGLYIPDVLNIPNVQITGPTVLKFYYRKNASSSMVSLEFAYSFGYGTGFGSDQCNLPLTDEWQLFTVELPADVYQVQITYYDPQRNPDAGVYIDDITISPVAQPTGEWQFVSDIETTSYTLTGLTVNTEYEMRVQSGCSDYSVSAPVFFVTTLCAAPTEVTVSDILHTTATVSWTGESENYTMSYREAERPEIFYEEDFDSNSIPSDWSTYTGLLNEVMNGNAQLDVNTATNYQNWRMANTIFGAYSVCCNIYATTNKWLVTPEFTFNTSGSLSFDLAQTRYNNSSAPTGDRTDDRFVVLIFSDDQWTILREWNNTGSAYVFNDITNTRQTISDIDLSAYVGKTVKIAFYGESTESNGDNDMHIDNVVINVLVPASPWQTLENIAATTYDLTNLTAGTEYEVKVQAACGAESEVVSFTTLSPNHKIFVNEGYWNEPNNWIPYGAPTIDQDVELRADVTIPNGYLATANQIEETWEHGITIEDGGQLCHTNYLLATVKKHVGGYGQENQGTNNGYILLAQPIQYTVSVEPNDESNIRTGVYDFYAWSRLGDNEGKEWINYGASNTSGLPMDEGNGYLYASQEDRELTFLANIRGNADAYPINNMEYTVPTSGAMFTAWNLIGNSFACNVYLTNARTNGSALPFYKMNADGNGFEAAIGTTIAPMEGVFYEKPASTTSYQPWFTRTQPTRSSNINISLAQGSTTATIDNAIIRFDDGETMGKLSFREGSSKVYIPVEGKDLAVAQAEGQVGEFPVNFKAEEDGTYTLSFTSEEVEFSYLHLIDNLIGNDVDLLSQDVISTEGKKSPSYTFTAKTTDGENRFKLVFATDGSQVDHLAFEAKDAGGLRSAALTPHVPEHQQTENQDADLFFQAISLVQGWNWWAPMAKISAAQLRTVLGSTLLELKAKEGNVAADDDLMPGQMYKLQTSADFEGVLNGLMAPASNISEPGVYWIGYTGETSSSITQALVSVNIFPNAGDKIISQDGGFAIFVYPGWTWQGTLTELTHGQGYVYIHVAQ